MCVLDAGFGGCGTWAVRPAHWVTEEPEGASSYWPGQAGGGGGGHCLRHWPINNRVDVWGPNCHPHDPPLTPFCALHRIDPSALTPPLCPVWRVP